MVAAYGPHFRKRTMIKLAGRITLIVALVACLGGSASAQTQATSTLFGADGTGQNTVKNLYELDPSNGAVVRTIGPIGHSVSGISADPADGTLYGSTGGRATANNPNPNSLIRIDKATGAGTVIGEFPNGPVADISFAPDGTLYGWSEGSDDLVTIDKTNGNYTVVGESGLSTFGSGLDSNSAGTLYFAGSSSTGPLYTVDRTTGDPTAGPTMNGNRDAIAALAFNGSDTLYGVDRDDTQTGVADLVTINTSSGAVTTLGAAPAQLDAIEFDRVIPPPPPPPAQPTQVPDTTDPRVTVAGVRSGSCVRRDFNIRVRSSDSSGVARVRVYVDGRQVALRRSTSFRLAIRARRLSPGRHRITIRSRDNAGNLASLTRRFARCARVAPAPTLTG
jgi:Bacterial Ig domain